MQAAEQSKRHRLARRVVFVTGQNRREDTAGFDVFGHQFEQLVVHRGTGGTAELPLRAQRMHQVVGAHASNPLSPAPRTSNAFPSASGSVTDSSLSHCS